MAGLLLIAEKTKCKYLSMLKLKNSKLAEKRKEKKIVWRALFRYTFDLNVSFEGFMNNSKPLL